MTGIGDLPLHRLLLRLHPRRFRSRYGPSILEAVRRQMGPTGVWGRAGVWLRTLGDLAGNLLASWAGLLVRAADGRSAATAVAALRAGPRRLVRSPGFTIPALASLGLGMGAATAGWTLLDAAFLRPLPYPEAQRLVAVNSTRAGEDISVSFPDYRDWVEQAERFQSMGSFARRNVTLTGDGPAEALRGLSIDSGLLSTLGVAPALGAAFGPEDDRPGAEPRVLLGHALWVDRFGADTDVVGRDVRLDGERYAVAGVMPEGFRFPDGVVLGASDLFLPVGLESGSEDYRSRGRHPGLYVVGRLTAGTSVDEARGELERIAANLAAAYPETNEDESVAVRSVREELVGDARAAVTVVALAGALVLLIAWANVTGLFLARLSTREHEVAVRGALGAGRPRIAALFLGESLWLGLGGAGLGAVVATFGLWLVRDQVAGLPGLDAVGPDLRVLGGLVALTLATAVSVGAIPALRAGARLERAPSASAGRRKGRLRDALVVAEISLAVVLMATGGVLGRSFLALAREDGGLRTEGVATFRLGFPESRYPESPLTLEAYRRVEEGLRALPGVTAVGGISVLPFSGSGSQSGILPADAPPEVDAVRTDVNVVTRGYFEAAGLPLVQGRTFRPGDGPDAPVAVVVDTRLAQRLWPDDDPIGQRVRGWGLEDAEVVGVVGHVRNYGVLQDSREELYMVHDQRALLRMYLMVRTEGDPGALAAGVRRVVADVDPDVPVAGFTRFAEVEEATLSRPRLAAGLGLALALLAAVLAVSGVYALMAFAVARRTRELGIRMAVGASRTSVRRLVLGRATLHLTLGGGLGLVGAWFASELLEGMVYGTAPRDPGVAVAAAILLGAAGLLAAAVPARRAARLDPARVLRQE